MTSQKIVLIVPPTVSTAPMAAMTMSETSSAYSSRSCPESSRDDRRNAWRIHCVLIVPPRRAAHVSPHACLASVDGVVAGHKARPHAAVLRRVLRSDELFRDRGEDAADVRAGGRDGTHRHERDQGDEQRVLEQVLAGVVAEQH